MTNSRASRLVLLVLVLVLFRLATGAVTDRYWVSGCTTANWSCNNAGTTNWGSASNTQDNASVPGSSNDVFFDGVGTGASDSTLSANITIKSADFTGYTNTLTQNATTVWTITPPGMLKMVSGMGFVNSGAAPIVMGGNLWTGGATHDMNDLMVADGSTIVIQDSFFGSRGSLNAIAGPLGATIDLNGKQITTTRVDMDAAGGGVRNLLMHGATLIVQFNGSSAGTTWQLTGTIDLTGTITFTDSGQGYQKTIQGDGLSFPATTIAANNFVISGNNTFTTLAVNNAGGADGLKLTAGSTQTVTSFSTNGSVGSLAKILSTSAESAATITQAVGLVCVDYMSIKDLTATGALWYAGSHSTNVSGNTGLTFGDCVSRIHVKAAPR